jgi:hypothetical protein
VRQVDLGRFPCDLLRGRRDEAETLLHRNVWQLECHPEPVLSCGQGYPGIWLEHNQDNLFYARWDLAVARAGHDIFISHQSADGLLPPYLRRANHPPAIGDGHVQSVLPFARSALEIARLCGDEAFLHRAYLAACRYDAWLMRWRNRRGTGLVEMFCEWDTGHDNSPRARDGGIPHACPGLDARICPDLPGLPIVSADLSAMLYGARCALAEMAAALGRPDEATRWRDQADDTRRCIHDLLWDEADEFFYDLAPDGFRRYRSEHITRLFLNRVVDQPLFDRIWNRHFTDPDGFDTPYPFPSLAPSDPRADRDGRTNSWGGQSQALTTLRAALWLEHYGHANDLDRLLAIWLEAIIANGCRYTQEMHPRSGQFSDCATGYTPTLLIAILAVDRYLGREPLFASTPSSA